MQFVGPLSIQTHCLKIVTMALCVTSGGWEGATTTWWKLSQEVEIEVERHQVTNHNGYTFFIL